MNKVQVRIMDTTMILQGAESEEYIRILADYINEKSESLLSRSQGKVTGQALKQLLVAINITDELFKERERIRQLEEEVSKVRQELNEYIETFSIKEDKAGNKEKPVGEKPAEKKPAGERLTEKKPDKVRTTEKDFKNGQAKPRKTDNA